MRPCFSMKQAVAPAAAAHRSCTVADCRRLLCCDLHSPWQRLWLWAEGGGDCPVDHTMLTAPGRRRKQTTVAATSPCPDSDCNPDVLTLHCRKRQSRQNGTSNFCSVVLLFLLWSPTETLQGRKSNGLSGPHPSRAQHEHGRASCPPARIVGHRRVGRRGKNTTKQFSTTSPPPRRTAPSRQN